MSLEKIIIFLILSLPILFVGKVYTIVSIYFFMGDPHSKFFQDSCKIDSCKNFNLVNLAGNTYSTMVLNLYFVLVLCC
jgi:hypothetical protein